MANNQPPYNAGGPYVNMLFGQTVDLPETQSAPDRSVLYMRSVALAPLSVGPCPWNLVDSGPSAGVVDGADLAAVLIAWCTTPGCAAGSPADFNGDGVVNGSDLAALLINWGPCPQ